MKNTELTTVPLEADVAPGRLEFCYMHFILPHLPVLGQVGPLFPIVSIHVIFSSTNMNIPFVALSAVVVRFDARNSNVENTIRRPARLDFPKAGNMSAPVEQLSRAKIPSFVTGGHP